MKTMNNFRKRMTVCMAILLAFVMLALSGYAYSEIIYGPELSDTGGGNTGADDGLSVFVSDKQDFSFKYDSRLTAEWDDDNGATVYVDSVGYIPYVLVYKQAESNITPKKVEQSFDNFTEQMRNKYGDNLTEIGKYQAYTFGGVQAYGIKYIYSAGAAPIEMLRLVYSYSNSIVMYTAKSAQGNSDTTYEALAVIMQSFQPDAHYYDEDASTAGDPKQNVPLTSLGEYSVERAQPLTLQTTLYDGGFFSFECPVGWRIETVGEYTSFGFKAYDPEIPERMIFFYCKAEYLTKSNAAKQRYQQFAYIVGANDLYGYWINAALPVLDPPTTEKFYTIYPDFMSVVYQTGVTYQYPVINNLFVMETFPNNTPTTPACLDNSIVRASFYSGSNVVCEGLLAGQVTNKMTYMDGGVDLGFYCIYDMMGVTAPSAEFSELQDTLTRCLSTFTFTQEYVEAARKATQEETERILQAARKMQAVYDSYNAAWSARQTTYDIISQKNSDATLGYDRLYDPDTGEIYRAELGFYDQYNTNREDYSNSRLQMIDDSTSGYYLDGVDYYIYK
jgi:hypothetical protein